MTIVIKKQKTILENSMNQDILNTPNKVRTRLNWLLKDQFKQANKILDKQLEMIL